MKFNALRLVLLTAVIVNQLWNAHANVASPRPFASHQPDGTPLSLHVRGDEWFHWYETLDGHAVVLDPHTGYWVYLLPNASGTNLLSSQRVGLDTPPAAAWHPFPTAEQLSARKVWQSVSPQQPHAMTVNSIGMGLMPVLLGNFSDTTPTVSAGTFSNLLFATGSGVQSMATYYREVSYGKFTVAAGPSGIQNWVTVPNTAAYYGATNPAYANAVDIRAGKFVRDVVVGAVAAGYDFSPYDLDGDGKVDVVCVVHAGLGEDYGGGPNTIWSHRSSLSAALGTNGPVIIQTKRGSITVDDYIVEPEVQPKPGGATGVDPIGIGVFCHEYGHALGLPDLYDPTYVSRGVGDWSVMSYGSHNGLVKDGDCPAHFDAWCKAKLGWLAPVNYTLDYQNVPFPAAAQTAFAARMWKDGLSSSEYFLVENRYRTNFDAALPASGLLIWHIDDSKGVLNDNNDNTKAWFPAVATFAANTNTGNNHVALVQADKLWELETKVNT
ncbi:MAG TPA: M6 family metalloprotease domain-containing protein, partial [Verrucomicrobiae bacterium]|nr:M6 family metalloprotease domain-containing protein [Verrucomicrobiae bacterium]